MSIWVQLMRRVVEQPDCVAEQERRGVQRDAYLFLMVRDALEMGFPLGKPYEDYVVRINARPAVQAALRRELMHRKKP